MIMLIENKSIEILNYDNVNKTGALKHLFINTFTAKRTCSRIYLSLPNARLKSKFKGTVDSCLFLTVIRNATICSLFQNVQGT